MTHFITTRHLIDANRAAIAAGKLGAQFSTECLYIYNVEDHSCGCSIGVALPPSVKDRLADNIKKYWEAASRDCPDYEPNVAVTENDDPIAKVNFDVKFEHLEVAVVTQILHDSWTTGSLVPIEARMEFIEGLKLRSKDFFMKVGHKVDLEVFNQWLDTVEADYCK